MIEAMYGAMEATNQATAATGVPQWYAGSGKGEAINSYPSGGVDES